MDISIMSPMILAFVEMFKQAGMPNKFAPVCAVAMGLLLSYSFNMEPQQGLVSAFLAVGLWSAGKNTIQSIQGK